MAEDTLSPAGATSSAMDPTPDSSSSISSAATSLPTQMMTTRAPGRRPALKVKIEDPSLSKEVPAVEFLKFTKLPVELRRNVFRENMPEPTLFHLESDYCQDWYDHAYEFIQKYQTTNTAATMPIYLEKIHVWKLKSFCLVEKAADEAIYGLNQLTNKPVNSERSLALIVVCWEFYHEFRFYFPFSLMAQTSTHPILLPPGAKGSIGHVRLHFNKYDIPHTGNLGYRSRQCEFSQLLKSDTWTRSIEVLHVPWNCFRKDDKVTMEVLVRGLLGVFQVFPSLREIQTASGMRLSSWRLNDGDWTLNGTHGDPCKSGNHGLDSDSEDVEDEEEDSDEEGEVEAEEEDEEESEDTDEEEGEESDFEENFDLRDWDFKDEAIEEIVRTLQAVPCVKSGKVKSPEIKVWISETDTSWVLSRDMPSQASLEEADN
ncbi:hypothetical protein DL98DRAFT_238290 [Cadophora sp. DSE1049]|nr:hypothetical protein DL98DRAFT_238290 [Cadophora sp. DSE1049]